MRTRRHLTLALRLATVLTAASTVACGTSTSVGEDAPETSTQTRAPSDTPGTAIGGVGTVALSTPTTGGGDRPLFVWEPVSGAADYVLTVRDAEGRPYWSWVGTQTQIVLGLIERPSSAPGPRVTAGMSWDVVARDVQGVPVAISQVREIAP